MAFPGEPACSACFVFDVVALPAEQRGTNAFLDASHFDFAQSDARIFHLGYLLLLDRLDQPDPICGTVSAAVLKRAQEAGSRQVWMWSARTAIGSPNSFARR